MSKKQQSPSAEPPKEHKFDLPRLTGLSWLSANVIRGLIPGMFRAAKLMGLDEAVFYFGFLPSGTKKLLCMKKAVFRGKQETLAEYYVRAHGHLLEDVSVIEISDDGTIKIVRDGASIPAEAYYG